MKTPNWTIRLGKRLKEHDDVIGLALLGFAIFRTCGTNAVLFYLAFVVLALSGLFHVAVLYFQAQVRNFVQALKAKGQ